MIFPQHYEEWRASTVADPIIRANVESLGPDSDYTDSSPILERLAEESLGSLGGWADQLVTKPVASILDRYESVCNGGWWVSGLDPLKGWKRCDWGQFKPDQPRLDPEDSKPIKYEAPAKTAPKAIFLDTGDPGFWPRVVSPECQQPLVITEGAKKAGALLSAGYAAIALVGVNAGYRVKDADGNPCSPYLCDDLAAVIKPGHSVYLAFDQDSKIDTRRKVRKALNKLAALLVDAGATVHICKWSPKEGKGVDDFIAGGGDIAKVITEAKLWSPPPEPDSTSTPGPGLSIDDLVARIQAWEEMEDPKDRWLAWELLKADSGKTHRDLMDLVKATKVKPEASDEEWAISAKTFGGLDLGAREWLLEGLLPANRSILIGADAKTGKSLLVYDWAYALATGQAWGEFPCDRPRKILIVQTDESEIDCQERINARGLNELDNVRIIRNFTPALMPRLRRVALDWGAEVIIFDSLTSIQRHSGYSPKDPEYGYWLYDLKDFAAECRITPILITHTNKAPIDLGLDKVAGSYSITAAVSEIFMLTRPTDPANDCDRVLVRVGSRSSGQSAWLIGLNLEDYSWEYKFPCTREGNPLEDEGGFTPDEKLNCRENVIRFLAHHQGKGFEALEIAETLGASYNNVRRICAELRSQGLILRRKAGKAWVYSCKLPSLDQVGDRVGDRPEEKNSGNLRSKDHNATQTHTGRDIQPDQISDLQVISRSPNDLPDHVDDQVEDISEEELAQLLGGASHES